MAESLTLLAPWDLPRDRPLSGNERVWVEYALTTLDTVSLQDDLELALGHVQRLLDEAPEIDVTACQFLEHQSQRQQEITKEYDRYFQVDHVESSSQPITLVQSLLIGCHTCLSRALEVNQSSGRPRYDRTFIDTQLDGFHSHVRLLRRVFSLESNT
ncbi:MAG: hypothetical protein AAF539_13880, partial [Planctomycetota bacterium]